MRVHSPVSLVIERRLSPTRGGEGVWVALMEAAGEMLQHAFSLLGLSDQHHHF